MLKITDLCAFFYTIMSWRKKSTDLCGTDDFLQICVFRCRNFQKMSNTYRYMFHYLVFSCVQPTPPPQQKYVVPILLLCISPQARRFFPQKDAICRNMLKNQKSALKFTFRLRRAGVYGKECKMHNFVDTILQTKNGFQKAAGEVLGFDTNLMVQFSVEELVIYNLTKRIRSWCVYKLHSVNNSFYSKQYEHL